METPNQLAVRLFTALDELVAREGRYLRGGFYELALENRQRASPLVQRLVTLAGAPGLADFRPRVAAVLERSDCHAEYLQGKLTEVVAEIRRTDRARHRTAQIAPLYADAPRRTAPRFQAAG